jgi:hypothetical protein
MNIMEIKDKKLVGVLAGIIFILVIALGVMYMSASKGPGLNGPQNNPPSDMTGGTASSRSGSTSANTDSFGTAAGDTGINSTTDSGNASAGTVAD